jgi:hypothetical protein
MTNLLPLIKPYDDCSKFDNFSVLSGIANRAPLILVFGEVSNPPVPRIGSRIDLRIPRIVSNIDPKSNDGNKAPIPDSVSIN